MSSPMILPLTVRRGAKDGLCMVGCRRSGRPSRRIVGGSDVVADTSVATPHRPSSSIVGSSSPSTPVLAPRSHRPHREGGGDGVRFRGRGDVDGFWRGLTGADIAQGTTSWERDGSKNEHEEVMCGGEFPGPSAASRVPFHAEEENGDLAQIQHARSSSRYEHRNSQAPCSSPFSDPPRLSTTNTRHRQPPLLQVRSMSSWLPEAAANFTVWGGAGFVIKTLHAGGTIPYWACMSLTNVLVRTSLFPIVVRGAREASNFARVTPEVQFLISMYQHDRRRMDANREIPEVRRRHFWMTLRNIRAVYRVHGVHPLAMFKAPLLQIPFFWYFASDINRIIRGSDLPLANDMTTGGTAWFVDLTEPDPYYVLPMLTGALVYANVELALGSKTLSGETSSKANFVMALKDFFQSIAIFIPSFMSSSPAGVQIYLVTSFVFTLGQSAALRDDTFRSYLGIPSLKAKPPEPKLATRFQKMKEKEHEAMEARGGPDEPVVGTGVLAPGWTTSFVGSERKSTISGGSEGGGPQAERDRNQTQSAASSHIPFVSEEAMDAANRGDKKFAFYNKQVIMSVDSDEQMTSESTEDSGDDATTSVKPAAIDIKKMNDRRRKKLGGKAATRGKTKTKSSNKKKNE